MEKKVLDPSDIKNKINYPCNAYFRHKTLIRPGHNKSPINFTFNIGSWLYESEESLLKYLYEDLKVRSFYMSSWSLDIVDLIVEEYTEEEYIKHVKKEGGIMGLRFSVPADDEYIVEIYNKSQKIK